MATQFYRTLDDIVKLKQENQQQLGDKVVEINETVDDSSYEDQLSALKANLKQIGVTNSDGSIEDRWNDRSRRQEFIKEHNIKPGSPRWFRVMYARPDLTGEDPFGE